MGKRILKRDLWALYLVYNLSDRKNAAKGTAFVDIYRIKSDAMQGYRRIKALKALGAKDWGDFIGYEIKPVDALWTRVHALQEKGDRQTIQQIARYGSDRFLIRRGE